MRAPTLVHNRLNPPPPPPLPIGCQHRHTVDITELRDNHDTVMCNDCGARWCVIPPWRLAERRRLRYVRI